MVIADDDAHNDGGDGEDDADFLLVRQSQA